MTWVYLNGEIVPLTEAKVAADDAALMFGRGLFETFRARGGKVYRVERHYSRLRHGAETLGIELSLELDDLIEAVAALVKKCHLDDVRVRLTLTAGSSGGRPAVLLQARVADEYPEGLYERGMTAAVATVRRNETSPLSRVKSLNYLDNLLAREEARRKGADEALLVNTRRVVAEGSASNLFIVRDGEAQTPPVEDGPLPGVTREAVMELARDLGISVREASISLEHVSRADEAFLTNAVMGVMPLVTVENAAIWEGRPGPVTCHLREVYERAAGARG